MNLEKKTVVVTGGNGALGRAVAARALELGAVVVLLDLDFAADIAPQLEQHKINLLDLDTTRTLFRSLGRVDIVCNIAGGFAMGTTAHADDDEEWDKMFAINVTTMRNVVKSVVPVMLEAGGGSIVNVGASGALKGQADMSAYTAAKSTVMRITESLSAELKSKSINVNAVLPTVIDTPVNRSAMPDADPGLWVAPEDLANVICFLASDDARAIHGALLPVSGLS